MKLVSKRITSVALVALVPLLFILGLLVVAKLLPLTAPFVTTDYSLTLLDRNGELLGARIAKDEQWRFKEEQALNKKFATALITFEDKRFYSHSGVDLLALMRALYIDIKQQKIVSGGSTLTMQLARVISGNKRRTIHQKLKEIWLAIRIEQHYSKQEIIKMYADHAPFGGNTVGISAASWRYFNRSATQLSWAEASLLAVLPNSPSLIHLARSRDQLKNKRNKLLQHLFRLKLISKIDLKLALIEPLPIKPKPMPSIAPLFMQTLAKQYRDKNVLHSTLDKDIQIQIRNVAKLHIQRLANEGIHNLAIVVIDNKSMQIKAYIGNQSYQQNARYANQLDIVDRPRSTGSTLKPLLFASAIDAGQITPKMLIRDTPSYYNGYIPTNYDGSYHGAVTAETALIKSLNVPTVSVLYTYGYRRFYEDLKAYGMTTLFRHADDYGLTLILGGAETTLSDLTMIYANMSAIAQDIHQGKFIKSKMLTTEENSIIGPSPISEGAAFITLETIKKLRRPEIQGLLSNLIKQRKVGWKTGTSYALRDAWAIGTTPEYTVGVWAGNATGEGVARLSGTKSAAPVLFSVFNQLGKTTWFTKSEMAVKQIKVCDDDGYLATKKCNSINIDMPRDTFLQKTSPNRMLVQINKDSKKRVHSGCEKALNMEQTYYFVLPPSQAFYYKKNHSDYKQLPAYTEKCKQGSKELIEIDYPVAGHSIYLPQDLDGNFSMITLKASSQQSSTNLYWHLDNKFIGSTHYIHQKTLFIKPGKHTLLVMDPQGNSVKRYFKVLAKDGTIN